MPRLSGRCGQGADLENQYPQVDFFTYYVAALLRYPTTLGR
jgi:hypothetical protein